MDTIVKKLVSFGFNKVEAKVYVTLLKHPQANGSQLAKTLGMSRSSVYDSLHLLYEKGAAILIPGETNIYKALDPAILLETIKKQYVKSIESLKKDLSHIPSSTPQDQYWNIKGFENVMLKARELLLSAEHEVFINANHDLHIFAGELAELEKRGVRVLLFSFKKLDIKDLPIEGFFNDSVQSSPGKECRRLMLAVDDKKVLIAGGPSESDYIGTYTGNNLLVSIVTEHIHHDIYLLKIGKNCDISTFSLGTRMEQRFKSEYTSDYTSDYTTGSTADKTTGNKKETAKSSRIEHLAIWTKDLEGLKEFYKTYFGGKPNSKYRNEKKGFESYFLTFESGARLEVMSMKGISEKKGDVQTQFLGLTHLCFSVGSKKAVADLTERLREDGYTITSECRTTGDGYFESQVLDPDGNRVEITV